MSVALLTLLGLAAPALGQDDDFDLDDDIELGDSPAPQPPAPPRPQDQDQIPGDEDEKDEGLEEFRDEGDGPDLLGEEGRAPVSGDTEQIYRATQAKLSKLGPDEEVAGWEAYLAQYPNSVFRPRIESRMEELMDQLYEGGIQRPGSETPVDALKAEIDFAQPLQLENINPRTRVQVGFEWGLPSYMNLVADYEHAFLRNLSAHAGVRRRYQGWNLEIGPRWALVKSTRTQTLVTLFADLHFNTLPAYPGLRPQLAAGKRFGKLDAQIQGGVDLELRTFLGAGDTKTTNLQTRFIGGANLYYAASDRVGLFAETYLNMKPVGEDGAFGGALYRFNVVTFGMKFYPANKGDAAEKDLEVNFGATVPYMQQYWQYHYGSIMGQANYYL